VGHYVRVNGIALYYEIHGSGRPLILLHGGLGAIEMFASILPSLAVGRQVVAVDLQGHGRTADIERPLRFELMADDVAALIAHLELPRVDIMGHSLGDDQGLRLHATDDRLKSNHVDRRRGCGHIPSGACRRDV
jgi:pimeloyl-ACP methyl ester carboxylesterase